MEPTVAEGAGPTGPAPTDRVSGPTQTAGELDVLAVGTLTFDVVESPDGAVTETMGGSAAFAAAGAAPWASVRMLGVVGPDYPTGALEDLEATGIDISGIRSSDLPTQRWHARYGGPGGVRETLSSDRAILSGFRPTLTDREREATGLLLGSTHPDVQDHVLTQWLQEDDAMSPREGRRRRVERVVALDSMSHWIEGHMPRLSELLPRVTILFGTTEELLTWAGAPTPQGAAARLLQRGPRVVVEKRGAAGARAYHRQSGARQEDEGIGDGGEAMDMESVAALTALSVDPTGAGDAFCGAFLGYWVRDPVGDGTSSERLRGALGAAVRAGALAVSATSWKGLCGEA